MIGGSCGSKIVNLISCCHCLISDSPRVGPQGWKPPGALKCILGHHRLVFHRLLYHVGFFFVFPIIATGAKGDGNYPLHRYDNIILKHGVLVTPLELFID